MRAILFFVLACCVSFVPACGGGDGGPSQPDSSSKTFYRCDLRDSDGAEPFAQLGLVLEFIPDSSGWRVAGTWSVHDLTPEAADRWPFSERRYSTLHGRVEGDRIEINLTPWIVCTYFDLSGRFTRRSFADFDGRWMYSTIEGLEDAGPVEAPVLDVHD